MVRAPFACCLALSKSSLRVGNRSVPLRKGQCSPAWACSMLTAGVSPQIVPGVVAGQIKQGKNGVSLGFEVVLVVVALKVIGPTQSAGD